MADQNNFVGGAPVAAVKIAPAPQGASATSESWAPDRNVAQGGLAGVITWGIMAVANHYGLDVPVYVQVAIPGIVIWLVTYVLPPTARDVAKRLNDRIVALAAALPTSRVSEKTVVLPKSAKVVSAPSP